MNIAIFGGSFDPPHKGHEQIVQKALETLEIDKLFVVPTYLNPFKTSFFLNENLRYSLLKKLFNKENKVKITDFEIKQKRAVPTVETVGFLQSLTNAKNIYLIIGEDNLKDLSLWENYDLLSNIVSFVVAKREKCEVACKNEYLELDINVPVSSSQIRKTRDLSFVPKEIRQDLKEIFKKENI